VSGGELRAMNDAMTAKSKNILTWVL